MLDRGGKVFKQTAPVIKLPDGSSEDDHLRLLGTLKQLDRLLLAQTTATTRAAPLTTRVHVQHCLRGRTSFNSTATTVKDFPLPKDVPLDRARLIDHLSQQLAAQDPAAAVNATVPALQRSTPPAPSMHASAH
ncbi:hypothetical protein GS421_09240 [Rhodococcus hoagii]|nr:hypothetical protein [Prescottella equi]